MADRGESLKPVLCDPGASEIVAEYLKRTPLSAEFHARAEELLPGGNSRQASFWRPYPITVKRGQGIHLTDIDGNEYLDLINNFTAMVHGHAYPPIIEAVQKQLPNGTGWAAGCPEQLDLAQEIVGRVASVEQIRFTNSGTEAANLALMIARTLTGREKVLMARYGYHGSLMEFEVGSFGSEGPMTFIAGFNDLEDFRAVLDRHGSDIAAVFLEAVQGPGGVYPANAEFLSGVRDAAHDAGALFVLDEVLTFRFGTGGCQAEYDLDPDLTMFGKLIGGGFPVGAVGGKKDHMKIFDPADLKAFHTGTFNANPITMAAGAVSVRELTAERIANMDSLAGELKSGLERAAAKTGLPLSINRFGSVLNLYFSPVAPESAILREDDEMMARFHLAALNRKLFIPSRGMIALSTVMTQNTIEEALERAGAAFEDVARELG